MASKRIAPVAFRARLALSRTSLRQVADRHASQRDRFDSYYCRPLTVRASTDLEWAIEP